jgi:L-threonylcarbamoyladenylate synthase
MASVLTADQESIGVAARRLAEGGLVAFPTDTVYGVGAHGFMPQAVERLYAAKRRPRGKPIALLLAAGEEIRQVARDVPPLAWELAERLWPGGLTLVLLRSSAVPDVVCGGGDTVAVRVPDHPVALALIRALGAPLAASSANLSGQPDPVTAEEVQEALGEAVDLILDGGRCPGGVPSTLLDVTRKPPRLLRPGAISLEELRAILPDLSTYPSSTCSFHCHAYRY